jgi:predicted PurR-regulated permease PerM
MDEQIQLASQALLLALCVSTLAVIAVLVYLLWLWLEIRKDIKRLLRRPEVERDRDGRRIQERV